MLGQHICLKIKLHKKKKNSKSISSKGIENLKLNNTNKKESDMLAMFYIDNQTGEYIHLVMRCST